MSSSKEDGGVEESSTAPSITDSDAVEHKTNKDEEGRMEEGRGHGATDDDEPELNVRTKNSGLETEQVSALGSSQTYSGEVNETMTSQDSEVHKAVRWGGRFKTTLLGKHHRDVREYANAELGLHGLKEAFDETNGWGRSALYIVCFIGFGLFFAYLTVPLAKEYRGRRTVFSVEAIGVSDGFPLPIVTVCPLGRGIACDCLLWRRLHCRYRFEKRNLTWMSRFDRWSCWTEFDFENLIDGEFPSRINPRCEDFLPNATTTPKDACESIDGNPFYEGDRLFKSVTDRESEPDGPYLTNEELYRYGTINLEKKLTFVRLLGSYVEAVNETFIVQDYQERTRFKRCVQLRIPPGDDRRRQWLPGAAHGILMIATGISADYFPLSEMSLAAAALEVNVNYIRDDAYIETYLPVESNQFLAIPAGTQSTLEYEIETLIRKPGWGSTESKTCSHTSVTRSACIGDVLIYQAAERCNCTKKKPREIDDDSTPTALDCAANEGTDEFECVLQYLLNASVATVPLLKCPVRCEAIRPRSVKHTAIPLTQPQITFLKNIEVASLPAPYPATVQPYPTEPDAMLSNRPFRSVTEESTIMLRVGLSKLEIEQLEEIPSISLGALIGAIGGNAGLWCGLSFSLIVEVFEFLLIASIYGHGFWPWAGRTARKTITGSAFSGASTG